MSEETKQPEENPEASPGTSRRNLLKQGAAILPLWVQLRLAYGFLVSEEHLKPPANPHDGAAPLRLARPSGCEAPCTSSCTQSCTSSCEKGGCTSACTAACTTTCEGTSKDTPPRPIPLPRPLPIPVPGCGEDFFVQRSLS